MPRRTDGMLRSSSPLQGSRGLSRRRLLGGLGVVAVAGMSVTILAACGETPLPEPPKSTGRNPTEPAGAPPITTTATSAEVAPAARGAVKIAMPTGNFLFDRVAVQVAGLATDQRRMASAPGELQVVQLSQTAGDQFDSLAAAAQAVLAEHDDLDAVMLTDASIAFDLAGLGHVTPLDEVVRSSADFDRAGFVPVALDALSDGGALFGLPLWLSANVLQYSEGLFARVGVEPPGPSGWTWDAFLDTAQRLTDVSGGGAAGQWGAWFPTGAAPSQQWIWQNQGQVVDIDAAESRVAEPPAVAAVEFMTRLRDAQIGPQIDFSQGPPPLAFNDGMPAIQGVPVAMFPSAVGGGFGGRGLNVVFAGRGAGGGAATRRRIATFRTGGGGRRADGGPGANGNRTDVGRRGVLPLPHAAEPASEARVFGLLSLLNTSPAPDAAFRMMDWLARELGAQAAIPARDATAAQLQAINGDYNEPDAAAILASAQAGRVIPGRRREAIAQALLENIDFPVMDEGLDPTTATTNAAAAIDAILAAEQ